MTQLLPALATLGPREAELPWPRHRLDGRGWLGLLAMLAQEDWTLVALFADGTDIHLALRDESDGTQGLVRYAAPSRRFPSVGRVRPGAIRLERAIRDIHGIEAEEAPDLRPWLDHGGGAYTFLPVEGEGVHQIPVGPVHAGIIEPGHFRFHANGELIVRLEERLGYTHKGIEALTIGRTPIEAARLAARVSGDSTVAHSLAFARAVEQAVATPAPARAAWLRALMAELERIANHFGDFAAICNDASFALIHAHATTARERVLQACETSFAHRLMMDRVVPGGVSADLPPDAPARITRLIDDSERTLAYLYRIYESKPSLLDRTVSTGVTLSELVHRFGAGGFVGRAAGRAVDARKSPGYPPYDGLEFDVPLSLEADVHARLTIRIQEMRQSFRLIRQILERLPGGEVRVELPAGRGDGIAMVESFRGDVFAYVRLDDAGRVARYHPRDPSWFQWPLLEAAVEGNIVADFPLINKSFNASYAGHDL
ncbi:MAG: nickel-dependent hydrogenase large subunit [Rhodospirillaceae bacterium]|nr:nickel-dependent hydrogenase large subunit [Rhodospirillaceae bacterium]